MGVVFTLCMAFAHIALADGATLSRSTAKAADVRMSWFGWLEPGKKAVIRGKVFGDVVRKYYRLGQKVKANEPLLDMQGSAVVKAAQAHQEAFNVARVKYINTERLRKKGYASRKDRDESWAAYKAAEALLEEKATLRKGVHITAPFSGVVYEDYVDEGSVLTSQDGKVCEVASLDGAHVTLILSYQDAKYLPEVQDFVVAEDVGHRMSATLFARSPVINKHTGGVRCVLQCADPVKGLFGATVRVFGVRKNVPDVHIVPYGALHFEDGKIGLLGVVEDTAHFYPAEVLSIDDGKVYLTGLPNVVRYMSVGHGSLLHGEKINLKKCDGNTG